MQKSYYTERKGAKDMDQNTAIEFFRLLMKNAMIPVWQFDRAHIPEFDMGLRASLGIDLLASIPQEMHIRERVIYQIQDTFGVCYMLLLLPGGEYLLAGPFLREQAGDAMIMSCMEKKGISPSLLPGMRGFYKRLAVIPSLHMILSAAAALGEMLWGSPENFALQKLTPEELLGFPAHGSDIHDLRLDRAEREAVELRYEVEAQLMYAVAHGQTHQAGTILGTFHPSHMENRSPVPLRNFKNYAIICNTLMRKAAQQGGVHPLYIDRLSSAMGHRIEQIVSIEEGQKLIFTMLHKYCLLVRNHTMKQYSQPVQSVILRVDTEIDGDLSLSAHAEHLGVNASYLSALFKKETGMTVTEYVSRARIDYSIYLLNSTDMQIQTIAQHCGIPDVNYFTRMFRRIIGKTPTEYRRYTRNITPQE